MLIKLLSNNACTYIASFLQNDTFNVMIIVFDLGFLALKLFQRINTDGIFGQSGSFFGDNT